MIQKIALLLLAALVVGSIAACDKVPQLPSGTQDPTQTQEPIQVIDYVAGLKLDLSSPTAKQEVTVKLFVDGDTTHFYVPNSVMPDGVLKARYLAINTPESTGKIEEFGKKASNFTKEKLSQATSIIVESDTATWDADSTGSRYMVWVWYKTAADADYRNLNLEILQNGLCLASSTANNRYGTTCMAALNQAKAQKLNVHSGQKDPDFYYGDAIELSLVELRTNIEEYIGMKVAFEGVITLNDNNSVYIEEFDPDTNMYFGMSVYYGFGFSGGGMDILSVGNRARIVGTVSYYEAGGTYQVSGLQYREFKPDDPSNIKKISDGHTPAYVKTDVDRFVNGKQEVDLEAGKKTFDYAYLAMSTSVAMDNLKVVSIYTTDKEESDSKGAMTLTCTCNGVTVKVRTGVFYDANGTLITEDAYLGKTINVRGIVDYFGGYQIKVLSPNEIVIQ